MEMEKIPIQEYKNALIRILFMLPKDLIKLLVDYVVVKYSMIYLKNYQLILNNAPFFFHGVFKKNLVFSGVYGNVVEFCNLETTTIQHCHNICFDTLKIHDNVMYFAKYRKIEVYDIVDDLFTHIKKISFDLPFNSFNYVLHEKYNFLFIRKNKIFQWR